MSAVDVGRFYQTMYLFEHDNFDLIDKLKDVKLKLSKEKHDKMEECYAQDTEEIYKSGEALLGLKTIEDNPWYKQLEDHKKDAMAKLQRGTLFEAKLYQFKTTVRKYPSTKCF